MDEPFAALDAIVRTRITQELLSWVEEEHLTVLLVTHDLEEAIFLADRIFFMSRHPGTIRETLITEFKQGRRFASHEEMMEAEGFHELERAIMHLMRDEMRGAEESPQAT
jgi:ABC-type nitrate/sulfonate/bicarbonate transport system ATPase subunit